MFLRPEELLEVICHPWSSKWLLIPRIVKTAKCVEVVSPTSRSWPQTWKACRIARNLEKKQPFQQKTLLKSAFQDFCKTGFAGNEREADQETFFGVTRDALIDYLRGYDWANSHSGWDETGVCRIQTTTKKAHLKIPKTAENFKNFLKFEKNCFSNHQELC